VTIVRALFAGPGARRALLPGRTGSVEIVFPLAAYLRLDEDWLLLAEPRAPFGPVTVSVSGFRELRLEPGSAVWVDGARLHLGRDAVSLERMRPRACRAPRLSADWRSIVRAAAAAAAELPAPPGSLLGGIAALGSGLSDGAVDQLAGRGPGLTPAGDDVLAGYAGSRSVIYPGDAVRGRLSARAAGRSSPLGLAYLRCAESGELPDSGARLLAAICAGSATDVRVGCGRLREWGASSGAALGWGITATFGQRSVSNSPTESGRRGDARSRTGAPPCLRTPALARGRNLVRADRPRTPAQVQVE
jgi:hypothetical protein